MRPTSRHYENSPFFSHLHNTLHNLAVLLPLDETLESGQRSMSRNRESEGHEDAGIRERKLESQRNGAAAFSEKARHRPRPIRGDYEDIRKRTIRYFESRGINEPDVWTDEVIDRAARRLEIAGDVEEPRSFVAGVARLVALDARRSSRKAQEALYRMKSEDSEAIEQDAVEQEDPRLAILQRCLNAFSPQDKSLLVQYYEGKLRDGRKGLCQSLGVGSGKLRVRAHRLRVRLESALQAEMSQLAHA